MISHRNYTASRVHALEQYIPSSLHLIDTQLKLRSTNFLTRQERSLVT
jgi:hypothetical protein